MITKMPNENQNKPFPKEITTVATQTESTKKRDDYTNMQQDVFPFMRSFISDINSPQNEVNNRYFQTQEQYKPKTSNPLYQNMTNSIILSKSNDSSSRMKAREMFKSYISNSPKLQSNNSIEHSGEANHFTSFNLSNSIFFSNQSNLLNKNLILNSKERMMNIPIEGSLNKQKINEMAPGTSRKHNKAVFIKSKLEKLLNSNYEDSPKHSIDNKIQIMTNDDPTHDINNEDNTGSCTSKKE